MTKLATFLATTLGKAVAVLVVIVLVLGALQLRSCMNARQQAAQSKVDRGQMGAAKESGADAVNTVGNVAANEATSEDLTRSNRDEILKAEGAGNAVSPAVRDAGLRSLCRRAAYRNRPECRVQQPHP